MKQYMGRIVSFVIIIRVAPNKHSIALCTKLKMLMTWPEVKKSTTRHTISIH